MGYECDIYYSGFITVLVDAKNEEQALEIARDKAARCRNKTEGYFNQELMPTLQPWREADSARKTE